MNTKQKIFCGVWVFAIIASAQAATTTSGITNKASQFSDVLSGMGATTTDSSNTELAETIRRQRALLDAQSEKANATGGTSNITTSNACDAGLRKCMTEKCGADFTKCAKDSTTVWGNKMDACRRNTKCTGHEYTLLAPEILADRNAAIELSYYNSVVNCGNKYNNCIFGICGKTLDKCLSKSAGDSAIAKCKSIADECREQDSGLPSRVMGIFGDMRTVATADAQKQEKRLYELRNLMHTQCTRLGAIFDERTLDCVYTVNFFAGEDHTLMASKKLYSGDTFQCTPDWFGVDITTYMENAQRLTRSQKGASAAAMGAGLGTAAGLISSNAIGRAIYTQNAEKQAKEACENDGGEWVSAGFNKGKKCDMTNAPQNCDKLGGKWDGEKCVKDNGNQPSGENKNGNQGQESSDPYATLNSSLEQYGVTDLANLAVKCLEYQEKECTPDKGCIWNQEKGKCFADSSQVKGLVLDQEATCNNKAKEKCTDKCEWKEESGKGKCVAKTDRQPGESSNQGNSSDNDKNNNKDTQNTNISTKVITEKGHKISATIKCGDKTAKQNILGKININAIPQKTMCNVSAPNCESQNIMANNINDQIKLSCPVIDNCFSSGGNWKNNACDCGDTKKLEGTECKDKTITELCEKDCQKYAKQITQNTRRIQISTIQNRECYQHCDEIMKNKCKQVSAVWTMTKQCDNNACVYECHSPR